jgi:hypothetical protein
LARGSDGAEGEGDGEDGSEGIGAREGIDRAMAEAMAEETKGNGRRNGEWKKKKILQAKRKREETGD